MNIMHDKIREIVREVLKEESQKIINPPSFENYYHEVLNIAHGTIGFANYIIQSNKFDCETKLFILREINREYLIQRQRMIPPFPKQEQ